MTPAKKVAEKAKQTPKPLLVAGVAAVVAALALAVRAVVRRRR